MIAEEKRAVDIWKEFSLTKDISIRNDIILKHEHLVKLVVCRLIPNYRNHVDFDDFIGCGIIGLMDAVEKFDHTKGVKFETYASIRIRGAIIDSMRKQDWISSSLRHKIKKLDDAFEKLEASHGRPATEIEVASYLNMNLKELQNLLVDSYSANIIYFDQLLANSTNGDNTLANIKDLPEDNYEKKELKDILVNNINLLSKREKMVITLYYFEELNLKEIGLILGVTESRISQMHSKALIKLRSAISKAM